MSLASTVASHTLKTITRPIRYIMNTPSEPTPAFEPDPLQPYGRTRPTLDTANGATLDTLDTSHGQFFLQSSGTHGIQKNGWKEKDQAGTHTRDLDQGGSQTSEGQFGSNSQ